MEILDTELPLSQDVVSGTSIMQQSESCIYMKITARWNGL